MPKKTKNERFSLIVVHHRREANLYNLLRGVANNTLLPHEVIVVNLGKRPVLKSEPDLNIFHVEMPYISGTELPVGKARNLGAEIAKNDKLFFLDVDCIPHVDFFSDILALDKLDKTLVMGTPRYLLTGKIDGVSPEVLHGISIAHENRPVVNTALMTDEVSLFWSLCFFITKTLFKTLGGFDENFKGYGAEDTDFAFTLRARKYSFMLSPATVYHQQHAVYCPPLHHFSSIIKNCRTFYEKWNVWPMDNWLSRFVEYRLIDWSPQATSIEILKMPSHQEISNALRPYAPYM